MTAPTAPVGGAGNLSESRDHSNDGNSRPENGMLAATDSTTGAADKAAAAEQLIGRSLAGASQVLGQAVWLFTQSPAHRHLFLADLEWRLLPPIALMQFRLFQAKGIPYGFVSWALVDEETEKRLERPDLRLRPQDWKSGNRAWIVDAIAPANEGKKLIEMVKDKVLKGHEIHVRPGLVAALRV